MKMNWWRSLRPWLTTQWGIANSFFHGMKKEVHLKVTSYAIGSVDGFKNLVKKYGQGNLTDSTLYHLCNVPLLAVTALVSLLLLLWSLSLCMILGLILGVSLPLTHLNNSEPKPGPSAGSGIK